MARNISSRLSDKVAIITGASSGIGRAMALRYAAEGARIVCVDLQECGSAEAQNVEEATTTHKLINDKNGEAIFVQADVGESQGWERIVGAAVEWKGKIDVLVNNAGISLESKNPQPIHLVPDEQYDQTMRVNARSVFLGCKHVITQMLKQDAIVDSASLGPARTKRRQRGAIVNISSIYGLVGDKLVSSYAASKGAVSLLTKQVAMDYAEHGIRVNAIAPGYVQTPMFTRTVGGRDTDIAQYLHGKHPLHGVGYPEDIASMAVVLASEDAAWMTGTVVSVDGGYAAQ